MRICIVGIGHMGAWLTKELMKDSHELALLEKEQGKLKNPLYNVLIDKADISEFKPELLINAVPLKQTIQVFGELMEFIPENCIIADMASVKSGLQEFYMTAGREFVSIHPMFGPTFGNMQSLSKESAVIIKESSEKGADFFNDFFSERHISIFHYSFDSHDEIMAYSLSLPFVSTLVFCACMKKEAVPGTTFKKHRDIAEGLLSEDDDLLSEILFNSFTLKQLEKVTSKLEFLKHVIYAKDDDEAKIFFKGLRDNICFEQSETITLSHRGSS